MEGKCFFFGAVRKERKRKGQEEKIREENGGIKEENGGIREENGEIREENGGSVLGAASEQERDEGKKCLTALHF